MSANNQDRRSLRAVRANWRAYDATFATKFRLSMRNTWRKMRTRSGCCGNDGEPGC